LLADRVKVALVYRLDPQALLTELGANHDGGMALRRAAITMVAWGRLLPTESDTMRLVG
jgi:hypothetical protein